MRPRKRSCRRRVWSTTTSRSWTSRGRRDESLNRELLRVGVSTRNKRLVLAPQESRLRKPAQGFSERDIGGQAAFLSLHQGHHGTDRRIGESGHAGRKPNTHDPPHTTFSTGTAGPTELGHSVFGVGPASALGVEASVGPGVNLAPSSTVIAAQKGAAGVSAET